MGTFDYSRAKATAERLIKKYGQEATLRKAGVPTGDPWRPVEGSTTDYKVQVVLTDYTDQDRDGTLIQQTDKKALIVGHEPGDADKLILNGKEHEIVRVMP